MRLEPIYTVTFTTPEAWSVEADADEGIEGRGSTLYGQLADIQKAGLFNLFTKMRAFGFDDRRTIWFFVDRLFRVRVYLVENRLYQTVVFGPPKFVKSKEAQRYLESFKVRED